MQNNEFEEDYPLIVTPSRWANSNACKEVTVAPARGLTKAEGLKLVGKLEEMQEKQAQLQAANVLRMYGKTQLP